MDVSSISSLSVNPQVGQNMRLASTVSATTWMKNCTVILKKKQTRNKISSIVGCVVFIQWNTLPWNWSNEIWTNYCQSNHMNESLKHNAEWKNLDTKEC